MAGKTVIRVIATTADGTRAALAAAVPLARGLGAPLVVLVPRVVPFPAQLEQEPESSVDFFARRYRAMVEAYGSTARIEICVCRRLDEIVNRVLEPDDTVVVGGAAGHWLTSAEERFARRLTGRVRRVIFVQTPREAPAADRSREVRECSTF